MSFPTTIKKVEPINKNFKITWFLEKVCNYDCSYCAPSDHSFITKKYTPMSLENMKKHWLRLYNELHYATITQQKIDIAFTGGEVTINKNFLPFIKWLTTHFNDILHNIYVTSNGSASLQYYTSLNQYITHLTLSSHMEFMNYDKFINTILALHNINTLANSPEKLYIQIMEELFYDPAQVDILKSFMIKHKIPYIIVPIA